MLDVEDTTVVVIVRVSLAFFLASCQVFACLAGKVVKDYSEYAYFVYNGFCLGLFLAKPLAALLLSHESENRDSLWSISFTSVLLAVILYHLHSRPQSAISSYTQLTTNQSGSGNDRHGQERDEEEMESEAHRDVKAESAEYSVWRRLMLTAILLEAGSCGWQLGFREHRTHELIVRVLLKIFIMSCIFGVICEETVFSPEQYRQQLLLSSIATPIGLFVGSLFASSTVVSVSVDSAFSQLLLGLSSGLWMALILCFSLPFDQHLTDNAASGLLQNEIAFHLFRKKRNANDSRSDGNSGEFSWLFVRLTAVAMGFIVSVLING